MKLVLLSGGSGKRLWPLSNDARSKQFLKVLEDQNHELVSMVQRVWNQLEQNGLSSSSYIATGKSQIEIMQSQVNSKIPIIVEPERRDTFPAIALAATYLYSMKDVSLDEIIAILPVDPYVENHFFQTVKQLEEILIKTGANLALIGVKPTYPSSKYGYIVPVENYDAADEYRLVSHFQEKPEEEEAAELIARQALWNCGVFAFKLGYLIQILQNQGLPIQFEELVKQYSNLPARSFDYEVVEKTSEIVVVPYDGYWKDLGTWNTLTEEMSNKRIGNGILSDDCVNTHLINETDIPVTVIGVSDVVVAVSPDGVLVTDKAASTRIKEFINYDRVPMFEERQWGWLRILDDQTYDDGRCVSTKRVGIKKGKNLSYRLHLNREEVWTIVRGNGEFVQNGNYMRVNEGNVLHIPVKSLHSIRAVTDLEVIVVQTGWKKEASQIIELYHTWDEIAQNCQKVH